MFEDSLGEAGEGDREQENDALLGQGRKTWDLPVWHDKSKSIIGDGLSSIIIVNSCKRILIDTKSPQGENGQGL